MHECGVSIRCTERNEIQHLDLKWYNYLHQITKYSSSQNIAVKSHCFLPVDIEIFSSHTLVTTNFPSPDIRTV